MDNPQHLRPLVADQPVVFVADDEPIVCNIVRIALEAMGMFVVAASDGKQALDLSRQFPGTIHALISDMVMPNLDGLGLCEQIRRDRPATKVLLMSACGCPVGDIVFLQKPFKLEEFKQTVSQIVPEASVTPSA